MKRDAATLSNVLTVKPSNARPFKKAFPRTPDRLNVLKDSETLVIQLILAVTSERLGTKEQCPGDSSKPLPDILSSSSRGSF